MARRTFSKGLRLPASEQAQILSRTGRTTLKALSTSSTSATPRPTERKPPRLGGALLLKGAFIYDASAIIKAPNHWVVRTGEENILLTFATGGRPLGMALFEGTAV